MLYNVIILLGIQQNGSFMDIHLSIFSRLFSHIGYYRILSRVSCAIHRSLLITYFMYSSVNVKSKLLIYSSPHVSTLVAINVFLKSECVSVL